VNGFDSEPPDPPDPTGGDGSEREVLTLVHHHPGRLRVRARAFREGDAVERVQRALDMEPGISAVSHNAKTGSLLVEYQAGLAQVESILYAIAEAAGLEMPPDDALPRRREPALLAIDTVREVNNIVHEITGHQADLRSLIPAGMAALAAYSFAVNKEARLPRWDNLLYWSYNIFSQLHRREIEAGRNARSPGHEGGTPGADSPAHPAKP